MKTPEERIDMNAFGKYKDFYYTKNENENVIRFQETPVFHNKKQEYSCGNFYKVVCPYKSQLSGNTDNLYLEAMCSLFYLNPKMTEEQFLKTFNYYKKIKGFDKPFAIWKKIYDNRLNIIRRKCYMVKMKSVVNPEYLATKNNISLDSKEMENEIRLWNARNGRKVWAEWLGWEIKHYVFEHLHTYDLSIEKIAEVFEVDRRTIIKHLAEYGIKFYNDYFEYKEYKEGSINKDDFVLHTIPLTDIMPQVIKRNISYFINQNKEKITYDLLTKECKYITNDGILKTCSTKRLWQFYKDNDDYNEKVKDYNKKFQNITPEEVKIEEDINDFSFLGIDESEFDDLNSCYKIKEPSQKIKDKSRIISDVDDFDDFFGLKVSK